MKGRIKNGLIILSTIVLTSCQTQKVTHHAASSKEVHFPVVEVPLPSSNFSFLYPPTPELATQHAPHKRITEELTQQDKSQIAVKDPFLFADGHTELIDLSMIPEGEYAFPLPKGKLISPYKGRRRHHSGVDIKTFANDTIVAAFDGIVRMSKPFAAYGNVIVVRHYNGLETIYSHNSKNLVKPDERVKAGQPIALTGRTGRATTEHLHFETRINGIHFDPSLVFDMANRKLKTKCLVCTQKGGHIQVRQVDLFPHQQMGPYRLQASN